jgi:hypothetical protein
VTLFKTWSIVRHSPVRLFSDLPRNAALNRATVAQGLGTARTLKDHSSLISKSVFFVPRRSPQHFAYFSRNLEDQIIVITL